MVLVFKTNIEKKQELKIREVLSELDEINQVDFDFEDCDNVLRIESNKDLISEIEALLTTKKIYCKELD